MAAARSRAHLLLVGLVLLLVLLLGCGEGSGTVAEGDGEEPAVEQQVGVRPPTDDLVPSDMAPPQELVIDELLEGQGPGASQGDVLVVHYVGLRWSDGGQFDASWDRGQPLEFELGAGRMIEGWEQGLVGLQPGGRRVLTIPPALAYGDRGAPPAIGPGETLVFVVDLVELN